MNTYQQLGHTPMPVLPDDTYRQLGQTPMSGSFRSSQILPAKKNVSVRLGLGLCSARNKAAMWEVEPHGQQENVKSQSILKSRPYGNKGIENALWRHICAVCVTRQSCSDLGMDTIPGTLTLIR